MASRGSFSSRNPVPIAVVGLVAIALVLGLALNLQRLPFLQGGETYTAAFGDASGLAVGEEVRVAGIKVGTVRDITLDHDRVIVEFTVDSGVPLGDRTEAGIELKSLLGQHYLSVTPAGDGELDDHFIPMDRTSTPLNVVPAFNQLADQSSKIDTDQVAEALDALSETLERTSPEVGRTLEGLSRISRTISSRDQELSTLFARAEQVSGVVAARDRDLGDLITASDEVVDVLVSRRRTITRLIAGTRELSEQLDGLVRDNGRVIGPALARLETVLKVLNDDAEAIDQTLTYAAPYAREFTDVGGTGRWFDASLKFPRGAAVCSTNDSTGLPGVLDDVLSQINQQTNGSDTPCIPLGPALQTELGTPTGIGGTS